MGKQWTLLFAMCLVIGVGQRESGAAPATACDSLSSLALPNTTITLAQAVDAGAFRPPTPAQVAAARGFGELPAFCRVAATLRPSADSDIKIEVWMPLADWNGKFQAVGNGGWSGSIAYPAMGNALRRGYATSSTDTGHAGSSASFALGHPEKLIDFGYRSEHEMTVAAKAIITTFYSRAPRYAYWNGCSAGGRQALKEAQRFPEDYDGIIAGAPASDWTGRSAEALRVAQAMHKDKDDASYIPPEKYRLIHDAVLQACDAADGVKDGIIEDPTRCTFDPQTLACSSSSSPASAVCLTQPQIDAARVVYATGLNSRSKREITGLQPGSELGWATWGGPQPLGIAYDHFRFIVFKDPAWDFHTFDFTTAVPLAEQIDSDTGGGMINAIDPNVKPYFARGGKLIQYHGWNDPQISPGSSVNYYKSVAAALGGTGQIDGSYRLFMVPGMAHCGGGEGPNTFDMLPALEQWVEHAQAPARVIASRLTAGKTERTRPLCPYPQVAVYTGKGSTDDAANFACKLR